ncbi:MAG: tripartite tricarboxylate transporter substrate-binding protein [Burkholderiales bacterium]
MLGWGELTKFFLAQPARLTLLTLAGYALCTVEALAQDPPPRPVRLLVPSVAGGPSDFVARLIAPKLGIALNRNVVVDARASVNGIVATEIAARAAPDGTTLAIGNNGTHVINAGLYRKLPYDPVRDFAAISKLVSAGTVLVAHPKLAANTLAEFIAAAKREPGKINIAVAGANGAVTTAVFKSATGIELNNIPYKGSAPSEFAVISGEVAVAMLSLPTVALYVKSGKMKALGISTARRSPLLPDVPTIAESGIAGFEFGNWHGLFAPAATPMAVVRTLYRDVARILADPEIRELVHARGSEIIANTPEEFAASLKSDIQRYRRIMAAAGIEAQ